MGTCPIGLVGKHSSISPVFPGNPVWTVMNDLNVLVLEDEPFQRLVAVTALKKVVPGSILEAADGKEAVAILESCGHVDIAICDLQMSGMDGLAFLRHASLSGKVHSVILSSEVDPILRQATISMIECLGLNFLGDLGKPFQPGADHRPVDPLQRSSPGPAATDRSRRAALRGGRGARPRQRRVRSLLPAQGGSWMAAA